jgi:hypothetical protein
VPLSRVSSRDRARNRQEERCVSVFDATPAVIGTEWSTLVGAVIRVERDVLSRSASTGLWRRSTEAAFYLASAAIPAARAAAAAIRDHWKIENTSHYSRDVTMAEDRSRIRVHPGISARLRSFAFILKANRRSSLSQDRFRVAIAGSSASSTSSASQSVEQLCPIPRRSTARRESAKYGYRLCSRSILPRAKIDQVQDAAGASDHRDRNNAMSL